jgi:RecJ-like exonuclease
MPDLLTIPCRWCRGTGRSGSTASGHYRCEDCDGAGRVTYCLDCNRRADDCRCEPEPEEQDDENEA